MIQSQNSAFFFGFCLHVTNILLLAGKGVFDNGHGMLSPCGRSGRPARDWPVKGVRPRVRKGFKKWICAALAAVLILGAVPVALTFASNEVTIADKNLEVGLREALGLSSGQKLTVAGMETLRELDLAGRGIVSLEGLQAAKNLESLSLRNNRISDLAPLSGMDKLVSLDLDGNRVYQLEAIGGLSSLRILQLSGNQVEDFTPLARLGSLSMVFCTENWLDLDKTTPSLTTFDAITARGGYVEYFPQADYTKPDDPNAPVQISDAALRKAVCTALGLAPEAKLTNQDLASLTELDAPGAKIASLSGLEVAVNLRRADLFGNNIADLTPLKGLPLTALDVRGNWIPDNAAQRAVVTALEKGGCQVEDSPQAQKADAPGDAVAPTFQSLTLSASALTPGDVLNVKARFTDESSGVRMARLVWRRSDGAREYSLVLTGQSDGSFAAELLCEEQMIGSYALSSMLVVDRAGNARAISPLPSSGAFVVKEEASVVKMAAKGNTRIDRQKGFVAGIPLGTDASAVKTLVDAGQNTLRVVDAAGKTVIKGALGTGMRLQMLDAKGKVLDSLTVVLYGDVSGDGEVDMLDLAMIRRYIIKALEFNGAQLEAANVSARMDYDKTAEVDMLDLALIRRYMIHEIDLKQ